MKAEHELSLAAARRLALVAQGFGRREGKRRIADVRKVASKVLAIQIDSISVLVRSHYLPGYSRLGPYPKDTVDRLAYARCELFECWGHATCLMPVQLYPLLRHRMTAQRAASPWTPGSPSPDSAYIEQVYNEVAERGPVAAADVSNPGAREGKWWGWSNGKMALEHLLNCGLVAIAGRRGFTRLYDVTERVIPQEVLDVPAPEPEEAQKQLICLSAKALGVATARQLGGYFGLHSHRIVVRGPDGKRPRPLWPRLVTELVEQGQLVPVTVEGWSEPGYMIPGTRMVRSMHERALLSPFDSFMWGSARQCCGFVQPLAQQLYVPAERRVYGYYVLPFLLGDTLVGRVDLKADRGSRKLLVQGAFHEPGQDATHVAAELAEELHRMRTWLELDTIEVSERGNLAATLRRSIQRHR
ncbi:winged helix-turn-helix domain-containing protein [Phytoactinopolyspora endophytica]|uniref:winged helix-turn-helix domain-containing protein n=1 Tax=Phytoactinopolyspora endophytica TaxID=1642495 RepID=UPI00101BA7E2|nr:crosslink repair DNA glycosylase YcaQ family protein [Phytoactinopolyspora endophytica]